jgi:toluene monooxygenase electron transfer component
MTEIAVTDRSGAHAAFVAQPGERLLQAGLAAGLGLPYECASGTCGSCRATLTEGEVENLWDASPGRKLCRRPGEILMCQSAAVRGPVGLGLPSALRGGGAPASATRRGRLSEFRRLTAEIGTFSVELEAPLDHQPGQFMLLSAADIRGPRAYSMTGYAPGERRLDFLARLKPDGGLTPRLFANALHGQSVELFGPLGRATLRDGDDRPFVAAAGGSGIAGILSIVEAALARDHFVRQPSEIVFGLRRMEGSYLLDRLSHAVRRAAGGLSVTVALSDEEPDAAFCAAHPELSFASGLVHEVLRRSLEARAKPEAIHFLAGPPAMVDAAMRMLVIDAKVSPGEIRFDRFG